MTSFSNYRHDDLKLELVADAVLDCRVLADASLGIPFTAESEESELDGKPISCIVQGNRLIFSCKPTVLTLKLAYLKMLTQLSSAEALETVCRPNPQNPQDAQWLIGNTLVYLSFCRYVLEGHERRHEIAIVGFELPLTHAIARIGLLYDLLLIKVRLPTIQESTIPKWKGRAMQFIELISIGIELDLFEGENQNQICNNLIKAFQVEAESDEPIYKQRFDALFRRSKSHLPLIHAYITKVEKAKSMKVVVAPE